ncbi:hypothetical protein E3N88_38923 [Mikania micrantha]|uniref:Uncharacterized protein n=1 Tax=Mikania micrantha TaxID=192012 RepID=A0A5N6LVC1_9ASTR|nr:hypothetical protein E3N88_38923 [Mikania micrantha]
MSNDLRSWFVTFSNGMIPLVENWGCDKKNTRNQPSLNPDPEEQTQVDERRIEPSITEDADPQPTATTGGQHARDQRSQATTQDRPRLRRRKSMARRKKRTSVISSDTEPESPPPEPKAIQAVVSAPEITPEAAPEITQSQEDLRDIHALMHEHLYIPLLKWSFNAQHNIFILTNYNGQIKHVDLVQLMVLAQPYVFDLEKLPLNNPNNGSDGRVAMKWRLTAFGRKKLHFGSNTASEGELTPTEGCTRQLLWKAQHLEDSDLQRFRRDKASEELKTSEDSPFVSRIKTKTFKVYPLTKTVADYFLSTKGTDTRHAGLIKYKKNIPKVRQQHTSLTQH